MYVCGWVVVVGGGLIWERYYVKIPSPPSVRIVWLILHHAVVIYYVDSIREYRRERLF